MRIDIASIGDSLVGMVVPRIQALAEPPSEPSACWEVRSWCDGAGCAFWWQRKHRYYVCDSGNGYTTNGSCGSEC